MRLSIILSSSYSISTIYTLFSPPRGAICSLPRSVNFFTQTTNSGAVFLFLYSLGEYHAWFRWNHLIEALKANIYQPEKAGASHIFLVPRPSVFLYRNLHNSAESCRMKTTKWSYFIESPRRLIYWYQKYFLPSSSTPTVMMTS